MGADLSCTSCVHYNSTSVTLADGENEKTPGDQVWGNEFTAPSSEIVVVECVERVNSSASTVDAVSSGGSDGGSSTSMGKRISMIKTSGFTGIVPSKLDRVKLALFKDRIHAAGIDTSKWGYGGAKSVEHLFWEAYEQKGCAIIALPDGGGFKRVTRLVKVRILAEIFGVEHLLQSRIQFMHDGQTIERRQVPLQKLKWVNVDSENVQDWRDEFYAENCSYTEPWSTFVTTMLEQRLGMSPAWQKQHLAERKSEYSYSTEDDVQSSGYPGLNTLYCIHQCTFRVKDPLHSGVALIGLPHGTEFATAEGDFHFTGGEEDDCLAIGTQLNIWMWKRVIAKSSAVAKVESKPSEPARVAQDYSMPNPLASQNAVMQMEKNMTSKSYKAPTGSLWASLQHSKTDWPRARRIASRILDPNYTLDLFADDLQAFPELNLYLLQNRTDPRKSVSEKSSSGRSTREEYQRTVNAFFAIYWLVRVDIDGQDGFCNGVDVEQNDWKPITLTGPDDTRVTTPEKRLNFKKNAMWPFFKRLLVNAGIFEQPKSGFPFKSGGKLQVNEKRLVSLLALTAIHDIMKMNFLLPDVQPEHAPYLGYSAGDTIGDHDHALSYIMDHFPDTLPSFRDLEDDEKRSIKFTQCNLSFNHGWFVQGEAPPGAIFTKFRETLIRDHRSSIGQRDVALYFVHWLTDLAGAEPTPLAGCEKFVTKFPLPVLNSFLRSFEFVERISDHSETAVNEEYLLMRWAENMPPLGPEPLGDWAIAKMRLACMAQMNAVKILRGFDNLVDEDRDILSVEMARTGCVGQHYSSIYIPRDAYQPAEGPVFLIYYGPAFLQSLRSDCPMKRLSILAEVYRCARELWPAEVSKVAQNVTIRVDMIKGLSIDEMLEACEKGDVWMMVKHNENEAFLEKSSNKKINKMISGGQQLQIIDLSCLLAYRDT